MRLHHEHSSIQDLSLDPEEVLRPPYDGIESQRLTYAGFPALEYRYEGDEIHYVGRVVVAHGYVVTAEARWKPSRGDGSLRVAVEFLDSLQIYPPAY